MVKTSVNPTGEDLECIDFPKTPPPDKGGSGDAEMSDERCFFSVLSIAYAAFATTTK